MGVRVAHLGLLSDQLVHEVEVLVVEDEPLHRELIILLIDLLQELIDIHFLLGVRNGGCAIILDDLHHGLGLSLVVVVFTILDQDRSLELAHR